jgi:hypothetical protein
MIDVATFFEANIKDLCPMLILANAVLCQEYPGIPKLADAVENSIDRNYSLCFPFASFLISISALPESIKRNKPAKA